MKCFAYVLLAISAIGQTAANSGQITGVVKDPDQAVVSGSQVTLTNQQTKAKITSVSDGQGVLSSNDGKCGQRAQIVAGLPERRVSCFPGA